MFIWCIDAAFAEGDSSQLNPKTSVSVVFGYAFGKFLLFPKSNIRSQWLGVKVRDLDLCSDVAFAEGDKNPKELETAHYGLMPTA
jgi:hypothetical protein